MTTPVQQQDMANLPGAYFDIPGVPGGATQWTEQDETSNNVAYVASSGASVRVQGIQFFKQTDVVCDWRLFVAAAQTYTAGTSTLTASAYAPYNLIGPLRLLVQNQYASVDVESGIDLYIFNLIRPYSTGEVLGGVNLGSNPAGSPVGGSAQGYLAAALAQANNINGAVWATGVASYNLSLRIPAAQYFDRYFDLRVTGEPVTQAHPALVSPQYMAGTTRVITPEVTINQGNAATLDTGPVNIGAGTGTYAGSGVLRFRRRAVYAGNPSVQPPVYAWQYRWRTVRQSMSGVSQLPIQLPLDSGQVLACYTRLFDPSASGGLGAPININTLTRWNLQYGSGLFAADFNTVGGISAAALMQAYWFKTHPSLLPAGVMAVDLALDERQQLTNARALNTLTTAGILVQLSFTASLSATAYAVLGIESLVYVT